jgi:predicted transcriptional regulator of viral defense system
MLRKGELSKETKKALKTFKTKGVISLSQAIKLGLSKPAITRLCASGQLHRVGMGFYVHPDSKADPKDYDFIVACSRFGKTSVIGGLTALFHYGLIEQAPRKIWVLISPNQKTISPLYRCVRTKTSPKIGVEDHGLFRITNLERTIIEGLRLAPKIGMRVAIKAARTAISEGRTDEVKLGKQATALGLRSVIEKYWDVIAI